jgi:hypothetical protein
MVTPVVTPAPPRLTPTMVSVPLNVVPPVTMAVTEVIIGTGGGDAGAPNTTVAKHNRTATTACLAAINALIRASMWANDNGFLASLVIADSQPGTSH